MKNSQWSKVTGFFHIKDLLAIELQFLQCLGHDCSIKQVDILRHGLPLLYIISPAVAPPFCLWQPEGITSTAIADHRPIQKNDFSPVSGSDWFSSTPCSSSGRVTKRKSTSSGLDNRPKRARLVDSQELRCRDVGYSSSSGEGGDAFLATPAEQATCRPVPLPTSQYPCKAVSNLTTKGHCRLPDRRSFLLQPILQC